MFPDLSLDKNTYFSLSSEIPPDYNGPSLHGATILTATAHSGRIIIQEIKDGLLNIHFSNFHFTETTKIPFRSKHNFLSSLSPIKNDFLFTGKGIRSLLLKQGRYALFYLAGKSYNAVFEKNQEYQLFNIHYPENIVAEFNPIFPDLDKSLFKKVKERKSFISEGLLPAEAKELTHRLLHIPHYEEKSKQFYLSNKIELSLFLLLQDQVLKSFGHPYEPIPELKQKMDLIASLLINQTNKTFTIRELARKVLMNDNTLMALFRKVYGTTVQNYHRDARLDEAKRLLLEGKMQVKEVCFKVGYKSITGFESEFKKQFGYSPGSLFKK